MELNQRKLQEMNALMNSVSLKIQRAMNEAMNEQVLPHLESYFRSVNGQPPHRGWNIPGERPERKSEVQRSEAVLEMSFSKT